MKKLAWGLTIAIPFLAGCTQRLGDFTVLSSKNVNLTANRGDRVKGDSCVPIIFFPIGVPDIKSAVDRAIESAGPGFDALEDAVLKARTIWFLVGQSCYIVEGTAVNTKRGRASLDGKDYLFHSLSRYPSAKPLTEARLKSLPIERMSRQATP